MKSIKGFTLAEALITVAVIGIIAALTIPVILEKTTSKIYKVRWKKAFSDFNRVARVMAFDYQVNTFEEIINIEAQKTGESYTVPKAIENIFTTYMNTVTHTGNDPRFGGWSCYGNTSNNDSMGGGDATNKTGYKYLSGEDAGYWVLGYFPTNCFAMSDYVFMVNAHESTIKANGYISIDVNGNRKPNIIGKDIFLLSIKDLYNVKAGGQKGVYDGENYKCDPKAKYGGPACSMEYLMKN